MREKSLDDILREAEISDEMECYPCKIAAGIGITRDLCKEFRELDCRKLEEIIGNPDLYSLKDAQKAIEEISLSTSGRARELLDYTLCLMKGECSLSE